MKEECRNCRFAVNRRLWGEDANSVVLVCRRFPPHLAKAGSTCTRPDEWCGEWKGKAEIVEKSTVLEHSL